MTNQLYKITTRRDGRMTFETPRRSWADRVKYLAAGVGVLAVFYIIALAFAWHV